MLRLDYLHSCSDCDLYVIYDTETHSNVSPTEKHNDDCCNIFVNHGLRAIELINWYCDKDESNKQQMIKALELLDQMSDVIGGTGYKVLNGFSGGRLYLETFNKNKLGQE